MDELRRKIEELESRLERLEKKKTKRKPAEEVGESPVARVRDTFLRSFRTVFGHDYAGWGAKENGLITGWLKSIPLDKALMYAQVYPHWKDRVVIQAGHPLHMLTSRYIQLDAHINRYPDVVRALIEARARENIEIGDQVKDHEVRIHADRQKNTNPRLGYGLQDAVQDNTNPPLLGSHSEPSGRQVLSEPGKNLLNGGSEKT